MNVLVYSGPGTTPHSVHQTLSSLRAHLSPHYAVHSVNAQLLATEPWQSKTAMLVIPGGADLPIAREFNGKINKLIKDWVKRGGKYLGFCSGGYYGSSRVEFEVGTEMEVSGPRELGFYPDVARGCAFKGFDYGSEQGSKVAEVRINSAALPGYETEERSFHYYNGGAVFVSAEKYVQDGKLEVLAEYVDPVDVDFGGVTSAAVVYCSVGEGKVILTGTHPEFLPELLTKDVNSSSSYNSVVDFLRKENQNREKFMKACLVKLGLKVNDHTESIPRLTPLLLTSPVPGVVEQITNQVVSNVGLSGEQCDLIQGKQDTFRLHIINKNNDDQSVDDGAAAAAQLSKQGEFEDPETVTKELYAYTTDLPDRKITAYFDLHSYYRQLRSLHGSLAPKSSMDVIPGSALLYAEVITSTSSILNNNLNVLSQLPSGLLCTASVQVAGRGRGGNVWVNPHGVVASSLVLDLPLANKQAPVVFVQYLAALAVVEAVKTYADGYEELPIRIKWPNDVYALKPSHYESSQSMDNGYVKISGILVNTNVIGKNYKVIIGTGINLSNAAPTTSINSTIEILNKARVARGDKPLSLISQEELLARYVFHLSKLYDTFVAQGFSPLLSLYYKHWFHTDQIVRLADHGHTRAKIIGITHDWGLLEAVEVDMQNRVVIGGGRFLLQPDGNSFDMFSGLISKKV